MAKPKLWKLNPMDFTKMNPTRQAKIEAAPAAALPATGGTQGEVYLQTAAEVSLTLPRHRSEITCTVCAPHFVYAPIMAGEQVGEAVWTMDGEIIARAPLYAMHDVQKTEKKRTPLSWLRTAFEILKGLIWKNK